MCLLLSVLIEFNKCEINKICFKIAEYRFITDYGNQPSILNGNDSCSFLFDGTINKTGNVWSPNYPGFYPRNVDCQYVFLGAKDQVVFVTFEYFDVEGRGQCDDKAKSDFVLFSNYRTQQIADFVEHSDLKTQ
ncbi:unnamed protein product [Meloidogyne enterolobii]|uniref:Uncharacterized protein n=1 Tax=Meloidogyne enterolobii TaxID=390850 RepID=A0ACB0XUG4_MELEN